ncbi:MAG: hypothetical protein LBV74_18735 [Tannerella sp.]|jgi:hypothetical protein|nr:hypothetical protein [Tannerella sp.]
MFDDKFENRLREHAGELFGPGKEPPAGHRARFEQRLKELEAGQNVPGNKEMSGSIMQTENASEVQKSGRIITLKKRLITAVAAAAILAGFVFLLNPFAEKQQDSELADVRNYYNMKLEEQADLTRQLIQHVDKTHREVLLANVEYIENEPIPELQIPDDEYIILIASVYTNKIETLRNIQEVIRENISVKI